MNKKRIQLKRFIFVLGLLIIFTTIIFGKYKTQSNVESLIGNTDTNVSPEDYLNPYVRARAEKISPRAAQIEIYIEFPDNFLSAQFNDRTFHLVPYPNSDGFEIPNYPIKPGGNRSGIYVYEEDKLIWESTNYIADISMGESTFQDLTNDNIPEIVTTDSGGGNVSYCIANIYKWNEEFFILIVPDPQEDGINLCSGLGDDEGIRDIDNDGVFELVTYSKIKTHPEIHDINDLLFLEETVVKQIYKYNGTEYFLWDEEIVPVEE